jgi:hypothetical protein
MRRKKQPEPDDREQSARFLDAAKKVEADINEKEFTKV